MKEKVESAQRLSEILQIYGDCSGQQVNRVKSSIFFSPNTPVPVRNDLKQHIPFTVEAFSERYLDLPTAVGPVLLTILVKEFVANCMEAWSGWSLVQARRFF
jgi:hypothetical protein